MSGTMKNMLKNFLKGMGSVLEIFQSAPSYKYPKSDAEAIKSDWEAVGKDFQKFI